MMGDQDSSYFTKTFPTEALSRLDTLTRKGVLSDSILQTIFRNSQIFSNEQDLKMGKFGSKQAKMLYLGIPELEYGPLDTQLRKAFLNFQSSTPADVLKVITKDPTGPSIILMQTAVKDPSSDSGGTKKYIFGGYANEAWRVGQGFFGTSSCFLFSFSKDQAMKVRLKSGENKALFAANWKLSFGE